MAVNKVIVKYLDGRMLKGRTLDFDPTRDVFHLNVIETNEEKGDLGMREVVMSRLKAVFFVKRFVGRPDYEEKKEFGEVSGGVGVKITIEFQDGEELNALAMGFSRTGKGFFVNPVDPESNNIRIYVIWATVRHVKNISLEERKGAKGLVVNKVVAKYIDGRMAKGSTLDFDPTKSAFHLDCIETNEEKGDFGMREVMMSDLKAVFFVKDFAGRPGYEEREEFMPQDERRGEKIGIRFQDGEKIYAFSKGFDQDRQGFFVNPVDPESNNIRIFIVSSTVRNIEVIP